MRDSKPLVDHTTECPHCMSLRAIAAVTSDGLNTADCLQVAAILKAIVFSALTAQGIDTEENISKLEEWFSNRYTKELAWHKASMGKMMEELRNPDSEFSRECVKAGLKPSQKDLN